jgi:hypothetical protein
MHHHALALKTIACSYYAQGSHVMLIQGDKPAGCEVSLREGGFQLGISNLTLFLDDVADTPDVDRYYLVQPVFSNGPMRTSIRLVHRDGQELIPVEPLSCRRHFCATGASQTFCFDEAFEDALRQLPPFNGANSQAPLPLVDIVAMGALYGGFSGFSRLFLRVEARPSPLALTERIAPEPVPDGLIQLPIQQLS